MSAADRALPPPPRIYLTGFMGAGKTTVGRELAGLLGRSFVDLDAEVEARAGAAVAEIFARRGEAAFRRLEREALEEVAGRERVVVATGGGTIAVGDNLELMGRTGLSVWLNPPFAVIASRIGSLGKGDRPLFRDEVQALALFRQRLPAYRRADLRIDVRADEAPRETAARIALMLGRRA